MQMNDEFILDDGFEQMDPEAKANEYIDIEGIETDEDYAALDVEEDGEQESISSDDVVSTPEQPLYDPESGEQIPYGLTVREWKRKKREDARKKQAGKKIPVSHTAPEPIENGNGLEEDQKEMSSSERVARKNLSEHGEDNLIPSISLASASEQDLNKDYQAMAGAVVMRGATALDGKTQGTYGEKCTGQGIIDAQALSVDGLIRKIQAERGAYLKDTGEISNLSPLRSGNKYIGRDYQTAEDAFEAIGMLAGYNFISADASEENDVKNGIKIIRQRTDLIKMVLGSSGMLAAASLDAAMGERQSYLMEKCVQMDVDLDHISGLIQRKDKAEAIRVLQEKGLTKYEARDVIKPGLLGKSAADNLLLAQKAQKELLSAMDRKLVRFSDEELKFLNSKDFFNTAENSRKIAVLTKRYFDKCGNGYLKGQNPAAEYLSIMRARESSRVMGPSVIGRPGLASKAVQLIDPHSYDLRTNLTKEVLLNRKARKIERFIRKDKRAFSEGNRTVFDFQKSVEKQASYVERRRIFKRNKHSLKNVLRTGMYFFREIDSDTTAGLNQIVAVKHGLEATYSLVRLGLESTWVASSPLRFIVRKTGIIDRAIETREKLKGNVMAAVNAKKVRREKKTPNSKSRRGINKARKPLNTSRPALGAIEKRDSIRKTKPSVKRSFKEKRQALQSKIMNNPVGRAILAPFSAIGKLSRAINKIKEVLATIGHWVLLAIGVTIVIWLVLIFIAGYLMTLGTSIDLSGRYVIMADQDLIEKWINKYLKLDDEKYEEAVSHADDEPIDPHAWGGTRLYHYGVYENLGSSFFNRSNTDCFYHEKDKTKKSGASNGFHVIYIDSDGNTLGNNTTNVKDVLSLTATMTGNDWYSYQTEAVDLMDKIYLVLNPEPAMVESEIYACSTGCDTYPRKHVDGDPANGNNWYDWAYRAYECSDASIYSEYERLLAEGVKFFPDDTYTYSSREYMERLVPQTTAGCNSTADFEFERVKVEDGHYTRYTKSPTGLEIPDYSSWEPSVYAYRLTGIDYYTYCGGQTYSYSYDESGSYFRNTDTEPYTYAPMYYSDDEHVGEVNNAGFYGRFSRDYSNTIPHTAIKACYGHKDLNIYITVLTMEDLIKAGGGPIEYRVPVHFSHETGEITEWETKSTMNINTYTRTNSNLQELTKVFYEKGGFDSEENLLITDQIYGEDWYELYGITTYGGAAIPDTLEKNSNNSRLDYSALEDISEIRENIVKLAYSQVGKIPYYWGGKASSKDLYANGFGQRVTPDYKGRSKKGLDCSGFVQLMFCMASGAELRDVGSTTKNLVPSLGLERISFSALEPGDIGMENLPGAQNNHIGIYAGNGMWIHCQGEPANNVVYNNTNCFRYYYSLGR